MTLIHVDDFLQNKVLRDLEINKNETLCAYFVNDLSLENNRTESKIALMNLENLSIEYLTIDVDPYGFFFCDDSLILKVKKADKSYLYSYNIATKVLDKIAAVPFELKDTYLGKTHIYFVADIQKNNDDSSIICSETAPFYEEGIGVRGKRISGLFRSSYDGKNIERITSLDMDVDQVDFDGFHNRIMLTVFKTNAMKPIDSDVYTYNMNSEALTKHTNGHYRISYIQSMTNNKIIFAGVDLREKSRNDNQQLYLIDTNQQKFDRLGTFIDLSNEFSAVITDSSSSSSKSMMKYKDCLYHIRVEKDKDVLYKTDLQGQHSIIDTGLNKIDCYRVLANGILVCGLKGLQLQELYWYRDGELRQLTDNNKWLNNYSIAPCEKTVFESEGFEIEGYVFKPINFDNTKKYPAVLFIHGGPKMIYSSVFMHDVQLLCANGYFVYFANPLGSDGRGEEFSNIRGGMLEKPYNQLMQFTDVLIDKYPQLDGERLGVIGGSYGGLMTNHIITQTTRFKAAVSERGISNMIATFTSSDIGYKFLYEYMGNKDDFWTNPKLFIEQSPIMNANKVKTPTLFIHGKDDYRCHYTESLNMYSALNYCGVITKFCLFEGENHGLSGEGKPRSRKRRYEEVLSWFNCYLNEEC